VEVLKRILAGLAALLALAHAHAQSSSSTARETQIQASLILRIVNFIDWTNDAGSHLTASFKPGSPFTICSYQGAAIGSLFQEINKPEWRGQPITFKSISRTDANAPADCSVLYIDSIIKTGNPPPQYNKLLTIGSTDDFVQAGGIIALVKRENRYSFDINLDSARQAGLRIETPLIRMANRVINNQ
jgi:hypothetical protein